MNATALHVVETSPNTDIVALAETLGQQFAASAAAADEQDCFVADNYKVLKQSGLVEAGVPRELGGGGAAIAELAEMLRVLGASLQLDRAGLLHAHPSGGDSRPGAGAPEGGAPSSRC